MSCTEITFDGANDPLRCKCQGAVLRTYKGMSHEGGNIALMAAIRVYRHHHPEDSVQDAQLTVERWVHAGQMH